MSISFDELYNAHAKMAYWAAYSVTKQQSAAEDAVQTVFFNAYKNLQAISDMDEPARKAFLYRSAVNAGIDLLRRDKHTTPVADMPVDAAAPEADGPEASAISRDTRNTVRAAIDQLPEKYRQPILLYYFADFDYHEISEALSLSEGTLKSRMSRARDMLQKTLKKGGVLHEEA